VASKKNKNGQIKLSPSALSLFKECPRCFWLHYKQDVKRPSGAFPSITGGMDRVIKDYFDTYRGALPPELEGKIKGNLIPDVELLKKWRHWKSGLEYIDDSIGAKIYGALDDCLVDDGVYIPLDYKTRGSAPKSGDSEKYYQTQLDTYALVLKVNGYPVGDVAYLIYYFPEKAENHGVVKFNIQPVELNASPDNAKMLFEEAVSVLKADVPGTNKSCDFCSWRNGN